VDELKLLQSFYLNYIWVMMSFAQPARFARLADRLLPWLAALSAGLLAFALWQGLIVAPADYQQGETVRIMFVHVPAAMLALAGWIIMSIASFGVLVWRHPLADVAAQSAAPVGAAFSAITLVTGSLWGKPMWGSWWVWDARLTSMLLLFFMYCGIMALRSAMGDPARAARPVAIFTLVGFINIPVVKFSVDWWNTLHQPASLLRISGPAIHEAIRTPLLFNALAFFVLFLTLHITLMRIELMRRKLRRLQLRATQMLEAAP
jgi:heme exporter protein C